MHATRLKTLGLWELGCLLWRQYVVLEPRAPMGAPRATPGRTTAAIRTLTASGDVRATAPGGRSGSEMAPRGVGVRSCVETGDEVVVVSGRGCDRDDGWGRGRVGVWIEIEEPGGRLEGTEAGGVVASSAGSAVEVVALETGHPADFESLDPNGFEHAREAVHDGLRRREGGGMDSPDDFRRTAVCDAEGERGEGGGDPIDDAPGHHADGHGVMVGRIRTEPDLEVPPGA